MSNVVLDVPVKYGQIRDELVNNPSSDIIVRMPDSRYISKSSLENLEQIDNSDRIRIQIIGGYDDDKINGYPNDCDIYLQDNIYTLDETKKILSELEKIESGIDPKWDDFQKLFYFIVSLQNRMMYHPLYETASSRDIRSLLPLINDFPVCAGYSLILKELCDRNGIECQFVVGVTTLEDMNRKSMTHAWNIVKINGEYIPIDLTWYTGAYRKGRDFSFADLANVNEFIKSHFPGKAEKIQDYAGTLKSIDAYKLRKATTMIGKDRKIDLMTFNMKRNDGSKYVIVQLGQFIEDNQYVYKYMYQDVMPNGQLGKPVILYSKFNVANLDCLMREESDVRYEILEQLENPNCSPEERAVLEKNLNILGNLDNINEIVNNVLFSKKNIDESVRREDYFIGDVNRDDNGFSTGVKIDLEFARGIGFRQKTYTRSDGSLFVLESGRSMMSRIYEGYYDEEDYCVLQNSVCIDRDLSQDSRSIIPNEFLSRERIDKCCRENNGYLGYVNSGGVVMYDSSKMDFFKNGFYSEATLQSSDFKNYFSDITFEEMIRCAKTYEKVVVDGKEVIRNKVSKKAVTDPKMQLRIDFSIIWFNATLNVLNSSENMKASDAISDKAKHNFEVIYDSIKNSMDVSGNIDPVTILDTVSQKENSLLESLVVNLFSSQYNTDVVNKLFRLINPSPFDEKHDIVHFGVGDFGKQNAYHLLEERRKKELDKMMLEVTRQSNGEISISKTTNSNLK